MKKFILWFLVFFTIGIAQEIGAQYLIITHDNFYNAILPLAEWKHKKGIRTKIARLSEIGSSQSQIKTYIQNAYNTWLIPPKYVLLVGAPNYLPFPQISYTYTDNYYTNMDADIYNEILSGRLTVHNTTEAQTVVNKMLLYERTPHMDDSLWMINSCLIVREDYDPYDDSIYWADIHSAKNLMLGAGYNIIDTLSRAAGDDKYDVINCVNQGRGFVLYRGQGVGNWWSPFDVNPHSTANGEKLPIVLSLTCTTIGTGSTPATAEQWFLTGTPTTPRGASGYFATTTIVTSGAYLRSAVSQGFFNGIFRAGKKTFGEACEAGRIAVYDKYGDAEEYRGFTTIGDPEMNIWTATPAILVATHPAVLPFGPDPCVIDVHVETGAGQPIPDARVCIWKDDDSVYVVDSTDVNGDVNFTLNPSPLTLGTMYVTVTKYNYLPYEGEAEIGGHVLNLTDFPMYGAESHPGFLQMCGAAVSQMVLNYMFWDSITYPGGPPMTFDDQSWLYDYGIAHNSGPGPYLDLNGLWHTVQDNKPMPYTQYGYNFTKSHNDDRDIMLKQICVWIDYTVGTYGGHEEGHPYHVPAAVPPYGNYTNWMAVRGIHTDQPAYPIPDTLTLYGFWVNDPYPVGFGGLGENSYKSIDAWNSTYYVGMTVGDYIGEYLGIFEPPEGAEGCHLICAPSKPRFTQLQTNQLKQVQSPTKGSPHTQNDREQWIIQAAIDGVTEELIPYDDDFASVFAQTVPGTPIFVNGSESSESVNNYISSDDYYVVPFIHPSSKIYTNPLSKTLTTSTTGLVKNTTIVIIIDALDGSFREASWTKTPVRYPSVSADEARQLAAEVAYTKLGMKVDTWKLQTELVYRGGIPYYPSWCVRIKDYAIYVDQQGFIDIEKD